MNKSSENKKGITLIALVVTIIILLILAGISISMLSGDNGIIQQATKARTKTTHANVYEQMQLEANAYTIDKATGVYSNSLIDYLKGKYIISNIAGEEEKWLINVTTLLGSNQSMGKGTYPNDVYVLEKQDTSIGSIVNTKVAATMTVKIATTTTAQEAYKVIYYGNSISDSMDIGILMDKNSDNSEHNENIKSANNRYILMENGKLYYLNDFIDTNKENLEFNGVNLNLTVFAQNIKELLDGGGVGNICYVTNDNKLYRKYINNMEPTLIEENIKKVISIDYRKIYYIDNEDTLYVCDFKNMNTVSKIAEDVELAEENYYLTKNGKIYRTQYSYNSGVTNTEETENIDELKNDLEQYKIYYDINNDLNASNYRRLATWFNTVSESCNISFIKGNNKWYYNTIIIHNGGVN